MFGIEPETLKAVSLVIGILGTLGIIAFFRGWLQKLWHFVARRFRRPDTVIDIPRQTIRLVQRPGGSVPWWHMGSAGEKPAMQVVGRYTVTNITTLGILILERLREWTRLYSREETRGHASVAGWRWVSVKS